MSSRQRRTRRGLVLGAGGVLGAAWSVGALQAVQDHSGWDPRGADFLVGTSAGSVLGVLVAAGVSTSELVADQYGRRTGGVLDECGSTSEAPLGLRLPSPPWMPGSPRLLAHHVRHPWTGSPLSWCAAAVPQGRSSPDTIRDLVEHVVERDRWPKSLHVLATDYDSGLRADLRDNAESSVTDAVMASCAIPGCFPPVRIGAARYVDGAIGSTTNADLLAQFEVDEAYVLAPMGTNEVHEPTRPISLLHRGLRYLFDRALRSEVQALREHGIRVTVLAPDNEVLDVMGANLLAANRRTAVLASALDSVRRQLEDYDQGVGELSGSG